MEWKHLGRHRLDQNRVFGADGGSEMRSEGLFSLVLCSSKAKMRLRISEEGSVVQVFPFYVLFSLSFKLPSSSTYRYSTRFNSLCASIFLAYLHFFACHVHTHFSTIWLHYYHYPLNHSQIHHSYLFHWHSCKNRFNFCSYHPLCCRCSFYSSR